MTSWPGSMRVGPIRDWPGPLTGNRAPSPFRGPGGKATPLSTTLRDLTRELAAIRAKDAELLVAIDPSQFRLDGRPYANAKSAHPGVILSFTHPAVGALSYPCDTYTSWEDNLRAIALALEALRKVDRYGVTRHGEQYRGFLSIEATAAPAGFATAADAETFLRNIAGLRSVADTPLRTILRRAQALTHPDRGGDAGLFQRVSLAEDKLRSEGLL